MERKLIPLRLLFIITDVDAGKKLDALFLEERLPVYYQCRAKGTAKKEVLDICGLGGRTRLITVTILPRAAVKKAFQDLSETLHINRRGRGIALTVPMNGMQESMRRVLKQEVCDRLQKEIERDEQQMRQEAAYAMILVSVREGFSDAVLDAAAKAGARGGSVLRGRRRGSASIVQFLGISTQDEQEFVMVVVPKEKKAGIMQAISDACGLRTEAQGVVMSIPVDEVAGLMGE